MQVTIKAMYLCPVCWRLVVREGLHEGRLECRCGETMEVVAASCGPVRQVKETAKGLMLGKVPAAGGRQRSCVCNT
jgi:hypothetical protein